MSNRSLAGIRLKAGAYRSVPAEYYGTPKEVWAFRTSGTAAAPEQAARNFLVANARLFGLRKDLAGLQKRRVIRSVGATHVIFKQVHARRRVHRGYVTVHLDRDGRVFLAKNRFVPAHLLPEAFETNIGRDEAMAIARASLPKRHRRSRTLETEQVWFPEGARLLPAWKTRIVRQKPREEWIVFVDARSGTILSSYDNVAEQEGVGLVFDPNPVTALGDHRPLLGKGRRVRPPPPATYRLVKLSGLDGDGTLSGRHVTTAPTRGKRIQRQDRQFLLRSHQRGFDEVMVYYHVDAACRYLQSLGFVGPRGIFRSQVRADVHGTRQDSSWYSPTDKMLTFGTGHVDDAEDAETILHELGHAIQDAIVPDFGQSAEGAAMGEGFGDYFAASLCAAKKPPRYRATVMSWDGLFDGLNGRLDPPCLRRVDRALTCAAFRKKGDEHDNGQIWSATLWDVRELLGAEKADRLIIESHFQLDAFTTFARGARAILDADRNLEKGRHVNALKRIFGRRKIRPL